MRRTLSPAFLLLACSLVSTGAAALPPDPTQLLQRADRSRNGWDSLVVRVKITNYESGKVDEEQLFEVSQKGTDKSYIEFLSPRDKGRHMLMLGDDMWIYLPDTSRPIRITPMERLSGGASNGDVARTNYADDYDAQVLRSEDVANVPCYVLDLTARRKGATYRRIHYWVRTSDAQPVKAEFFLASGKHLKSATFDEYQTVAGVRVLRRMTIHDRVRQGWSTVIEYLSIAPRALPDKLFHQGRSDRF
jgi:outer membrane lipoprotein-sorting protein